MSSISPTSPPFSDASQKRFARGMRFPPVAKRRPLHVYPLVLLSIVFAAAGCDASLIKAKGKVVKDGMPVNIAARERLQVIFFPHSQDAQKPSDVYPANVRHSEGTFAVPGKTGKGIPPGKYRITVEVLGPLDIDQLKGRFDAKNTPFVREVTTSNEELLLDIGMPPG